MAQCPSCGAGLTKKEIHKAVYEANFRTVNNSTVGGTIKGVGAFFDDGNVYDDRSHLKEVIEITYECDFCGNVYEEWEIKQKKETLEMNGIESDMMEFLIGDK